MTAPYHINLGITLSPNETNTDLVASFNTSGSSSSQNSFMSSAISDKTEFFNHIDITKRFKFEGSLIKTDSLCHYVLPSKSGALLLDTGGLYNDKDWTLYKASDVKAQVSFKVGSSSGKNHTITTVDGSGTMVLDNFNQILTNKTIDSAKNKITIDASDIKTGVLPVLNGGTGARGFTAGELLQGNDSGPITNSGIQTSSITMLGAVQTLTNKTIKSSENTLRVNVDDLVGVLAVDQGGTGVRGFVENELLVGGDTGGICNSGLNSETVVTLNGDQVLTGKFINSLHNNLTIFEANIEDLGSYITADSQDILTNKTIDRETNIINILEADISDLKNYITASDFGKGYFESLGSKQLTTNSTDNNLFQDWVCNKTGKWNISVKVKWDSYSTGYRTIKIRVNSIVIASLVECAESTGYTDQLLVINYMSLSETDQITITANQSSGGVLNVLAEAQTWYGISWAGL